MILSDNETKVDLLNNEAIAATIIALVRERTDHPITIGVHGDWGAGKSSVLEMIEVGLQQHDNVLCLKFNGWRYQGFEDAKIALIEGIVTGLLDKRPALAKATGAAGDAVKDILHRIDWLKVAKKYGPLALAAINAHAGNVLGEHTPLLGAFLAQSTDTAKPADKEKTKETGHSEDLVKPPGVSGSKSVPHEVAAFRRAFDDLLKHAKIEQLVVLIDDLDRCLPDTAIETLEAIRLFVFTSRTAFVVAADEAMIEYAVRKHFPDLPETTGPQSYARNYLEKLIQVPFRIPALGETETCIYVTLLLVGAQLGEDDPDFVKLIGTARDRLKRPWTSRPIDAADVKLSLGDKGDRVQEALILSAQIGPVLASGTVGNPRQIKRFLNTLVLRKRTADARGFGDEVKLPVLAKLMLAERFQSRLFEQIAHSVVSTPNGLCADLAVLESVEATSSGSATKTKAPSGASSSPGVESTQLAEWLSSPTVRDWAKISPPLAGIDLRPYLFVTKDRKNYFGAATVLGHLAEVAENLLGPKLAVHALELELRQLAVHEAAQILELVRSRIVGGDAFEVEPPGAAGIAVLIRAQPALQRNLLDLLEALPSKRLGPWACSGWEGVIKDPEQIQRFDQLLGTWSRDGGTLLKASAASVMKVRQKGIC